MSDRYDSPFERLEPPAGGLRRLRARIARDDRRRVRVRVARAAVATAFVLVVTLTVVLLAPRTEPRVPPQGFHLARMRLGLEPLPSEPLTIPPGRRGVVGALRVPLPTDDVVFYHVASTVPDEAPPGDERN